LVWRSQQAAAVAARVGRGSRDTAGHSVEVKEKKRREERRSDGRCRSVRTRCAFPPLSSAATVAEATWESSATASGKLFFKLSSFFVFSRRHAYFCESLTRVYRTYISFFPEKNQANGPPCSSVPPERPAAAVQVKFVGRTSRAFSRRITFHRLAASYRRVWHNHGTIDAHRRHTTAKENKKNH